MQSNHTPLRAMAHIWHYVLVCATLVVLLAACGSSSSGSTALPTPTPTTAPTATATTGTTPTASSSGALVKTAMAKVSGKSETILTNANGMTLYYRTSDAPPSSVCSGVCAGAWPPLLASGSGTPTSATSLPGKLTAIADANGNQVEYNGHPLYTFSGDSAAGQTNGEGVGGVWHAVTPGLT